MVAKKDVPGPVDMYLRKILKSIAGENFRGSMMMVQIPGQMTRVGTSTVNVHEAAVIKHLVKHIFASGACSTLPTPTADGTRCTILVTTPYQAQAQLMNQMLMELVPIYAVQNLFRVCTIDSAQGQDADITIHSVTRNDGKGISNDKARLCVAQSRAKWLNIFVVSEGAEAGRNIKTMVKYLQACKCKNTNWPVHTCRHCNTIHGGPCPDCTIAKCKTKAPHKWFTCSARWTEPNLMTASMPFHDWQALQDVKLDEPLA